MTNETRDTDETDGGDPERTPPERRRSNLSRRTVLKGAAATAALGLGASTATGRQPPAVEKCDAWDEIDLEGGTFLLMNNQWSTERADSCIFRNDDGSYGWQWTHGSQGGGPNYPEVVLGAKPWGTTTDTSLFPVQIGDVEELEVELDVDLTVTTGTNWNLALEWWLMDERPEAETQKGDAITHEVMTVLDRGSGHSHGRMIEERAFTDAYGNEFDYWTNYDWDWNYHVFKTSDDAVPEKIDFTAHLEYLRESVDDDVGFPGDLWMTGIELGDEYWENTAGEATFRTYDATLNGETVTSGSDSGGGDGDETAPTTPSVTVSETTATSVTVSWDPASDAGGSGLDHYAVTVDGVRRTTVPAGTTETTVSGLAAGTTYELGVTALDGAGNESPPSTVTVTTDAADGGDYAELVVNDFEDWPGQNALGQWSDADAFVTRSVADGTLRLEYDDSGWFASNVRQSVAEFTRLELDVRGATGGEGTEIQLEVGGVEGSLAELSGDSVTTEMATLSVDLDAVGVDTSMVDDVALIFWQGSAGTVEIEEIRFAAGSEDDGDTVAPGTPGPVTASDVTQTSATVSWPGVTDEGGSGLAQYVVDLGGTRTATVPAGTTQTTVSGLDPDTTYEFTVRAEDEAGNVSDPATVAVRTQPEDDAGADALVVNDYDGSPAWPTGNDLGHWNGAGSFANGGDGEVLDGALVLEYDNAGWFVEQINQDVSEYSTLVFRIRGESGGEEDDFRLEVGGTSGVFADFTDDSISTSYSAVEVDLETNGIDAASPGELRLNFWQGASGTIAIDEIRFE